MSILLILIFISRAFYDVAAVKVADMKSFGLGWTFTTDMVSYRKRIVVGKGSTF